MMSKSVPTVYILHGEDQLEIDQFVDVLHSRLDDAGVQMMNITRFDGQNLDFGQLQACVLAVPFMTRRRIVELINPLKALGNDEARARFIELLDQVPSTTAFVIIQIPALTDEKRKRKGDFHWLENWANENPGRAYIRQFSLPIGGAMVRWIMNTAQESGGSFSQDAAESLASLVGSDTSLANHEIEKLLAYVDYKRPVSDEDVDYVSISIPQGDIFNMVDAISVQDGKQAAAMLHALLETQDPASIFGMVVRQFRLLILARELVDQGGGPDDLVREYKVKPRTHPYVANKIFTQVRRFRMPELVAAYQRLLEIDLNAKTSQVPLDLELDMFVSEFTSHSGS